MKNDVNDFLTQIDAIKKTRNEIKSRLDESADIDSESPALTKDEMKEIGTEIDTLKDKLKAIEDGFNHQIVLFNSYNDSADLIKKYEETLALLLSDGPQMMSSLEKLKIVEDTFGIFINEVLSNNVNYD